MGEFGTVRRKVQKLQATFFSHFLCIFDHQGNPSLAEKKGEKQPGASGGHIGGGIGDAFQAPALLDTTKGQLSCFC
jgi:hypothetical protein